MQSKMDPDLPSSSSNNNNNSPFMQPYSYPQQQPQAPQYVYQPQPQHQPQQHQQVYLVPAGGMVGQPYTLLSTAASPYPVPQPQQVITVYAQPHHTLLPRRENAARGLAISCLICYILSYFSIITSVASIGISLHMVNKGYIRENKAAVIAFSVLELIAFCFIPAFSWYSECTYSYYYPYTECVYYGWIAFVVWAAFTIAFGIPRVVFCYQYDKEEEQEIQQERRPPVAYEDVPDAKMWAVVSLILYLVSYVSVVPYVVSVAISLHMVRKGYIIKKKADVIAFSILELFSFAFLCSFGWFFYTDCSYYYGYYGYDCTTIWLGWIALVVWGAFAIAFGIPRVVFCWRYDRVPVYAPAVPNNLTGATPMRNYGSASESGY